jgi:quercetin dioxygenase-like cupin family protein
MEQQPKQPTTKGAAEWFSGDVWIDSVTQGEPPSRLNIAAVHFSPGARTAWHSHEGGQTLYVTEGRGLVRSRGGQTIEIRAGDVIYTPCGEETLARCHRPTLHDPPFNHRRHRELGRPSHRRRVSPKQCRKTSK